MLDLKNHFNYLWHILRFKVFIIVNYYLKFRLDFPYRYSWYQSLSLELELARIGSSDLGGLCVCEGPCRWISESVRVFTCYFLFSFHYGLTID